MQDTFRELADPVAAVRRIDAVPMLLKVLCETTGMGFAVVARVTDRSWTACAVHDDIAFGVKPGAQLPVETTLCFESRATLAPIVIEHAATDPHFGLHPACELYRFESYVSVPIVLADGHYFGNLCALDPAPAKVAEPRILSMFTCFAGLIASQLALELAREQVGTDLRHERADGALREEFIAILGHELRNPLQSLVAIGDILERRLIDPTSLDYVARLKTTMRRMSALIEDLLDFARGRFGGGVDIEDTNVENVNQALGTVVQELQDAHPESRIDAEFQVDQAVRCDLRRLQQIAANLLGNALAHGAPGGAVKFTARADGRDFVLEVWNAGEPIPPESIDKIFEPFWRHSTSPSRQGLGLGLHICAQIVRAHGGDIAVKSNQQDGTTFTVRLPLGSARMVPRAALAGGERARH